MAPAFQAMKCAACYAAVHALAGLQEVAAALFASLTAVPDGRALFRECRHTFTEVLAAVGAHDEVLHVRQILLQQAAQSLLADLLRHRSERCQTLAQAGGGGIDCISRHDLRQVATTMRFL